MSGETGKERIARQRSRGFRPLNTLNSGSKPHFLSEPSANKVWLTSEYKVDPLCSPIVDSADVDSKMVRERSPGKTSSTPHRSSQQADRRPLANISAKMQSPSLKPASQGLESAAQSNKPAQPEFGKASPLRNPLRRPEPSIFIPKSKPLKQSPQSNPLYSKQPAQSQSQGIESSNPIPVAQRSFYLPGQRPQPAPAPSYGTALEAAQMFSNQSTKRNFGSDSYAIPIPSNAPLPTVKAAPRPTFSSLGPNTYYQPYMQAPKPAAVRTNADDQESIDPDALIEAEVPVFGEPDLNTYVESSQANENIKNLLEGAFDNEAEKSKTRLRSRAKKASSNGSAKTAKSLASRLEALSVKPEDEGKAATAEGADGVEEDEDDGTVEGLKVKLLPHQVEGVQWMIDKEIGVPKRKGPAPKGGILADDMGLGKTIQSMTLILTNARPALDAKPEHKGQKLPGEAVSKSTLVVAPLALIKQWEDEIKTKVSPSHALRVLVHHGASRTKSAAELKKYDVVITTYQTLTSEHAGSTPLNVGSMNPIRIGCMGVHWYRVILDEAHSIKNRNAKSTLAAYDLQAWYRWCLTGTPMQNNLDELQSLIRFLQIKPYSERDNWKEKIIDPMKRGKGMLAMKRLQVFLGLVMKRRTKEVLKKEGALNFGGKEDAAKAEGMKIVKREVETVECDFDPEEMNFYLELQSRADKQIELIKQRGKNDYMTALVLLLRLRQACNHPRLIEMAISKDKDAMETGAPAGRNGKVDDREMDSLADLMGGVTVQSKHCDVCQVELSRSQVQDGFVRCEDCSVDSTRTGSRPHKVTVKKHKRLLKEMKLPPGIRANKTVIRSRNRRVLDESDGDSEGEGEWIGNGPAQRVNLGKAGGSDDEDAEGGGDTLGSIDSDTDTSDDDGTEDSQDSEDDQSEAELFNDVRIKSEDDSEISILAGMKPSGRSGSKPSTKIRRLLRILHAEVPKYKTIVFSQFTTMLDLIEPHLRSANFRFARYDGSMRSDAREAALHALRTDAKCRILLCSLKCGSLGLNLTAASRVVIVEPFWNPFVEEQAIDRVHRLNQTVDVKVYRLTVRGTVEAQILELQERKRSLAAAAIEGAAQVNVNNLGMAELLGLFEHDNNNEIESGTMTEADRKLYERLGQDTKLLDGASSGFQQAESIKAKQSKAKEHVVYGRRWE